jgi:transcriptional antiterminator NusG
LDSENKNVDNINWYAIRTYAGKEKSVKNGVLRLIEEFHLKDKILDVVLPTEDLIVASKNKKERTKVVERPIYPGYLFVKMVFSDSLLFQIRELPQVSNFVGSSEEGPTALSEAEISKILKTVHDRPAPRPLHEFQKNELVRITEGNFSGFEGTVEEYDAKQGILKLNLKMLGRNTPIEIEYTQVEKMED